MIHSYPSAWAVRPGIWLVITFALGCARDGVPAPQAVPVTIGAVEQRAVPFELAAVGTVEPFQAVTVQPQVTGQLMRVTFREGDEVEKGQILFQIDPRQFNAALAQAEAILARDRAQAENANEVLKRVQALVEGDNVTRQEYDQARANAAAAQATLAASEAGVEQARLNVQYATMRAPIAGRTGSLLVRAGNLVRADVSQLVTINQIRPILVRFAVPAANLSLIQQHRQSGDLRVEAIPTGGGQPSDGALSFMDNAVDTTTGTILLKGSFPNREGTLWPGGFVNVRLRLYVETTAIVVPAAAVMTGQVGTYVFVIQGDSTATMKKVTVEREAGDLAVVNGELKPGDRVVTDGQMLLRQGARVQIRTGAAPAPGQEGT
jgi:multidrug efflux system membrane fusion protein